MLINIMIIEVGGVVGTTLQKYISYLFVATPKKLRVACLDFIAQNLKVLGHI